MALAILERASRKPTAAPSNEAPLSAPSADESWASPSNESDTSSSSGVKMSPQDQTSVPTMYDTLDDGKKWRLPQYDPAKEAEVVEDEMKKLAMACSFHQ